MGIMQFGNATNRHHVDEIDVRRTPEGTLFEIACALLLVAAWVCALLEYNGLAAKAGNPFSEAARTEATEARFSLIVTAAAFTIAVAYALYSAYHPLTKVNLPIALTTVSQQIMVVRMVRVMAIALSVMAVGIASAPKGGVLIVLGGLALTIATAYYLYRITKAKLH